jgi:predicted GTPase
MLVTTPSASALALSVSAGALYPQGIPIRHEEELVALIKERQVDEVPASGVETSTRTG